MDGDFFWRVELVDRAEIWNTIEVVVREQGLSLYDLDYPSPKAGVLRVYISKADGSCTGISVEECSRVSSRLLDHEQVEDLMPGSTTLEVSSPGVNRRLNRPEHFLGALGERVKLNVDTSAFSSDQLSAQVEAPASDEDDSNEDEASPVSEEVSKSVRTPRFKVLKGKLSAFDGEYLVVEEDVAKQGMKIPLISVSKARVDFLF